MPALPAAAPAVHRVENGCGDAVVDDAGDGADERPVDHAGEPRPAGQGRPEGDKGVEPGEKLAVAHDVELPRGRFAVEPEPREIGSLETVEFHRATRRLRVAPVDVDLAGADRAGVVVDHGHPGHGCEGKLPALRVDVPAATRRKTGRRWRPARAGTIFGLRKHPCQRTAMRPLHLLLPLFLALSACAGIVVEDAPSSTLRQDPQPPRLGRAQTEANFRAVVSRVEPVAESECRRRTTGVDCDFLIVVDDRPGLPANAFQTLDRNGRPIIGFTTELIADARNRDELAFVLSHEAAHHIEGHIAQTQRSAVGGALIGAVLAGALGLEQSAGQAVTDIGATVGSRRFSKSFELEADALGTIITARAGYDPLIGARFFQRVPDPGDRFLGTHPPNADRIRTVERVAAGL